MIKKFLAEKINYIILFFCLISIILFLVFAKFSSFSLIIAAIDILLCLSFLYLKNNELLSYALVFNVSYIFLSLNNNLFNLWIVIIGVICALITNYIFFKKYKNDFVKFIYSLIIFFVFIQLIYTISLLNYSLYAISLFITIIYYLLSGLIKLNLDNNLKLVPILRYSIIFVLLLSILILNNNLLII